MADSFRQRASSKHRRTRLERTACPALDGCRQAEHAGQQCPSGRTEAFWGLPQAQYENAEHCRTGVSIAWQAATSWRHGEAIVPIFIGRGAPLFQTFGKTIEAAACLGPAGRSQGIVLDP